MSMISPVGTLLILMISWRGIGAKPILADYVENIGANSRTGGEVESVHQETRDNACSSIPSGDRSPRLWTWTNGQMTDRTLSSSEMVAAAAATWRASDEALQLATARERQQIWNASWNSTFICLDILDTSQAVFVKESFLINSKNVIVSKRIF